MHILKQKRGTDMANNQNDNNMDMEQEEMTVTLTLDDGSELECVVLTIFEAGNRDYIALLPSEGIEARKAKYICTVTARMQTATRIWTTLRTTRSTRSFLTLSMSC